MRLFPVDVSENVESKLVEYAFGQKKVLVAGSLAMPAVAVVGFHRTHAEWFILWGAAAVLLLIVRLINTHAFERRAIRLGRLRGWQVCLLTGACLNGLLIGIGGAATVRGGDPFTQMIAITMLSAFVMGTAARIASIPAAAIGCVLFAEIPLAVTGLAAGTVTLLFYALFIVMSMTSAFSVVRTLYARTVDYLSSNEETARLNRELAQANGRLERVASTDALTGVANRRRFDEVLRQESRRCQRDGGHLSLLMLDVDSFKAYNDRYGHDTGDDALCRVAAEGVLCVRRPTDLFARYGGEEFVAVLPDTDSAGAAELAERIRAGVENLRRDNADASPPFLTVSVGVATVHGVRACGGDEHDLVRRADEAMYVAKKAGRNRVCVWGCAHDTEHVAAADRLRDTSETSATVSP